MPTKKTKHTTRQRPLTEEEAAKYRGVRAQIEQERADIEARHEERMSGLISIDATFAELRNLRKEKGLSLADLRDLTGMDRSALSKLETGERGNPTVQTMVRYAQAVGKKVVVGLVDAE